jgi:uncharacterized membrane protein
LIGVGGAIGCVFAAVSLCVSVVAFPLLLDRDVGLLVAVETSLRVAAKNPLAVALWGLIVAALLIAGSLPVFVGLAIVMPVLGHGTWRFYRRAVAREPADEVALEDPRAWKTAPLPKTPRSLLFPGPSRSEN